MKKYSTDTNNLIGPGDWYKAEEVDRQLGKAVDEISEYSSYKSDNEMAVFVWCSNCECYNSGKYCDSDICKEQVRKYLEAKE